MRGFKFLDRRALALAHDIIMALISIPLSLWIRLGDNILIFPPIFIIKHVIVYTLLATAVFLWLQLYRGVWRYVSMNEFITISIAVILINILYFPLMLILNNHVSIPRSIIIISALVTTSCMSFSRILYRFFHDRWETHHDFERGKMPRAFVLLIGSTNQAEMFIRDTQRNAHSKYDIVGILDKTTRHVGRQIHGVNILGVIEDLPHILKKLEMNKQLPQHIVIADQDIQDHRRIYALLNLHHYKIELAKLPDLENFTKSTPNGIEIKPIQIEDLLGRKQIGLNRNAMQSLIHDRRILVTGAGGTIGSELVRQIASFKPKNIILLDHSEYLLYTIDLEIKESFADVSTTIVLADVTDNALIDDVVKQAQPEIVFHAAALKHVPIAEANPCQTILTNVIGTKNLAHACQKYGVQAMVMISTDKAVSPAGVMGATKRLAESLCQSMDANKKKMPRFITTRFGNVLGSTGSVVPLFKRQLAQGGPLKVTHPDIKRFFMTVQEAVELVLEAAVVGISTPQTASRIFVLDMGEPIRILDLAEHIIQLAGFKPYDDIKIEFSGLRPGEKLVEELFSPNEKLMETSCAGLMLAAPTLSEYKTLATGIDQLENWARDRQTALALQKLKELVPEYRPLDLG